MKLKNNFLLNIQNKKGTKLFSLWWFFTLAIIGLGIVMGIFIFSSAEVDIRELEAEILYNRIIHCIAQNQVLIDDALNEDFDIFDECHLSKVAFDSEPFYFRIKFLDERERKIRTDIRAKSSMESTCNIILGEGDLDPTLEAEKYPVCLRKKEQVLSSEGVEAKKVTLEILVASSNEGEIIPK